MDDALNRFGDRVARAAAACSAPEPLLRHTAKGEAAGATGRNERKTISPISRSAATTTFWASRLLSKVYNARAILRDLRLPDVGESIWARFSQPREKTLWYYRSLADTFRNRLPGQLANELHEIIEVLENGSVLRSTRDGETDGQRHQLGWQARQSSANSIQSTEELVMTIERVMPAL